MASSSSARRFSWRSLRASGATAWMPQLGFKPLPQRANVLRTELGERVNVELVIVDKARECRSGAGGEFTALELPGDRPFLELPRVVLEELCSEPGVERLPHDFSKVAAVDLFSLQPVLDALEKRRFVGQRGEGNDAVRIGPIVHRLASLDLLGPAVAKESQDSDGHAVRPQSAFLGEAAPPLLLAPLLEQRVD